MKTIAMLLIPAAFGGILLLQACSTSEPAAPAVADGEAREGVVRSGSADLSSDVPINPAGTLIDHLRRIPGLTISGNHIQLRGPSSIQRRGTESPLFVINNVPVGNNYEDVASLIQMENVKAINLYRGGQAFRRFGSNAAYGVIAITTD